MKKYFVLGLFAALLFFGGSGLFAYAQIAGITLPTIPTGVTATIVPPAQASISWTASSESSGTIEGYYVYRNGSQITTTGGTSFTDSGLTSGIYSYTVAAYDANGNVSNQSTPSSITFIQDTTAPSAPSNLSVSGTTSTDSSYVPTTLTISWTAATDNVGVVGYYVYRNGTQIVSSTSAFNGTSITDSVVPGTYTYKVAAYDAAQNFSSPSAPLNVTVNVDNTAPSVPTNVIVQQTSGSGVNLSWATSTDNIGTTGYKIYRNGSLIAGNVGGPPYSDSNLSVGDGYSYTVAAYDAAGNLSQQSTPVPVTIQPANGPSIPYILSAGIVGSSTIKISWSPSGGIVPITGYTLYRNSGEIASLGATSTSYLDTGLATGTYYAYSLTATDLSGAVSTSSPSSTLVELTGSGFASGSTLPQPLVPPVVSPPVASSGGAPSAPVSPAAAGSTSTTFTQPLYFGLRNSQVSALQSLLAGNGYLSPANATGFFGNLTLHALQKFQCDQNIVCTGGAGWGIVGPRTRAILNKLGGAVSGAGAGVGTSTAVTVTTTLTPASTTSLSEQLQALEAELANLQQQVH